MKYKSITFSNQTIINYQDEGSGPETVVLLHGLMNSIDVWTSYVFHYMKRVRVIAIDLLGHGHSSSFSDVHSMDMQADMVKAVLDHTGVKDCVMVGHSMGGYISLAFAKRYPYIIKGLCLLNSHAMADDEKGKENRLRVCNFIMNNKAEHIISFIPGLFDKTNIERLSHEIKDIQDRAMTMSHESIIAAQKGMIERESSLRLLASAKFPFLFIVGKKDSRIAVESIMAQAIIPNHAEVLILENVGHMAHLEAIEIVQDRLLSFVISSYNV